MTFHYWIKGEGLTSWKYWPRTNKVTAIWVQIGNEAFVNVAWLYSSMAHEYQHVNQALADPKTTEENEPMAEFSAYTWEAFHATETGVINDQLGMQDIGRRTKQQGWDKMTALEQEENQETYDGAIIIIQDAIGDPSWIP